MMALWLQITLFAILVGVILILGVAWSVADEDIAQLRVDRDMLKEQYGDLHREIKWLTDRHWAQADKLTEAKAVEIACAECSEKAEPNDYLCQACRALLEEQSSALT